MELKWLLSSRESKQTNLKQYLLSIIILAVVTFASIPLADTENYHLVSFIMLFVVSIQASFMHIGPVLLSSTFSALIWNFFFIPPHYTFHIDKTEDILIFGLFFIIALVNGILTARVRRQKKLADLKEKRTTALFILTRELSKAVGIGEVITVAHAELERNFGVNSFFILQDGNDRLRDSVQQQNQVRLTDQEYSVANEVFNQMDRAKVKSQTIGKYRFIPMHGIRMNPGVLAIEGSYALEGEIQAYWETFITQISNALEREFLGELAQKVRLLDESDRLYKTLFNSISHELRIPISTIMGASDSIINSTVSEQVQKALCNEIFTASLRLNRLVENLLNISRLESGHISVRLDWYDMNDLLNKVNADLKEELSLFELKINILDDVPLVKVDFGLMEQVLYNIIFNATQYGPTGSEIRLNVSYSQGFLIIEISDCGPGFPEDKLKQVFQKFFRVNSSKTGGLGLGLSIAKGFVEAHKGTISVSNAPNAGAVFTIIIPSEKPEIDNI